jgi:hypothetical protein
MTNTSVYVNHCPRDTGRNYQNTDQNINNRLNIHGPETHQRGSFMYVTSELLKKINDREKSGKSTGSEKSASRRDITLADIMSRTFPEVKALTRAALTWDETNFLFQASRRALSENRLAESRILSRASRRLARAVRLGIRKSGQRLSYDDMFGGRAGKFTRPGSVASMFSPAGYLTALWGEAVKLKFKDPARNNGWHLTARRPDLASLTLSQVNIDGIQIIQPGSGPPCRY